MIYKQCPELKIERHGRFGDPPFEGVVEEFQRCVGKECSACISGGKIYLCAKLPFTHPSGEKDYMICAYEEEDEK